MKETGEGLINSTKSNTNRKYGGDNKFYMSKSDGSNSMINFR